MSHCKRSNYNNFLGWISIECDVNYCVAKLFWLSMKIDFIFTCKKVNADIINVTQILNSRVIKNVYVPWNIRQTLQTLP